MAVCYYCGICRGPMGPTDAIVPMVVEFIGQSSVRHADGFLCGYIAAFIEHRDEQFLKDAGIVPEKIET